MGAGLLVVAACSTDTPNKKPAPQPSSPGRGSARDAQATETPPVTATTPNSFVRRGDPTFILGTRGDAITDRRIAGQVRLMRGLALPRSRVVSDTTIDLARGPATWPSNPLVYGGADDNAVIAGLAAKLPYQVTRSRIVVGGQVFEGAGYRLIAVTPATDDHPEFVLFAGTGDGAMAEINGGIPMSTPIVVADRFGALVQGTWARVGGKLVAKLGPRQRRIEYRTVRRTLAAARGARRATVSFAFPSMVPAADSEAALIDACMRGLRRAVDKLALDAPVDMWIYLYPDRRSKMSLTGNRGDGHAVPSSRTLHMLATSPAAAEQLVAHEATHVLAYYGYGPAGSALMGEGLAVWVSGQYAGRSIASWTRSMRPISIATLLGPGWMKQNEADKYPLAGLVVEVAIAQVGLTRVLEHLLGANVETWDASCARAGTTPAKLERGVRAALGRPASE